VSFGTRARDRCYGRLILWRMAQAFHWASVDDEFSRMKSDQLGRCYTAENQYFHNIYCILNRSELSFVPHTVVAQVFPLCEEIIFPDRGQPLQVIGYIVST